MDDRTADTQTKIAELKRLLGGSTPEALQAAADNAFLALDFRGTDEMLGLEPVDGVLLNELRSLAYGALFELAQTPAEIVAFATRVRLEAAFAWTGRAYEALLKLPNDGDALYELGLYRFNALGSTKSHAESLKLYERSAQLGNVNALFELHCMHAQGLGTPVDAKRALDYCRKAAEGGQARAMTNMGAFYATGNGVPQDDTLARGWYERAAALGHGRAAAIAGVMHGLEQGEGWSDDEAKRLFALADELGFDWRPIADASDLAVEYFDSAADDGGDAPSGTPW